MAAVATSIVTPAAKALLAEPARSGADLNLAVLSEAPMRKAFQVIEVVSPDGQPDWADRLAEIGFLAGEQVQVLSRVPGGDPIAVRVGTSTFALRRAEAACVRVAPRS